jgi:hypothetical protein
MKNKIFLLLVIFTLQSCTTIKQFSNQKIEIKEACKVTEMNSKMIYFDASIDGSKKIFLFDTGATTSVLTDSSGVITLESKKFGNFGSVKGADGKYSDLKTFTAKFSSELFESQNKVFAYLAKPQTSCELKENFVGIIGMDLFFKNKSSLSLDFSNNKICNLNSSQQNELIKNDFVLIKSECKRGQIFIFLTIKNKDYRFKLDTGFVGTLTIPFTEDLDFSEFISVTYLGKMFRTASAFTSGEESFYENVPVLFGSEKINSKLLVSKSIKAQNVGMGFIKAYDWIIDYNQNKVYVKKNKNNIGATINKNAFQYRASNENGKLYIVTKQSTLNLYKLNDEIVSINNKIVTSENICESQDLLNNTQNWDTLNIEIKK